MRSAICAGLLVALHVGRLKDEGRAHSAHVSLGKLNNVRESARDLPRSAHDPGRERTQ